jgi:hypothetical protein
MGNRKWQIANGEWQIKGGKELHLLAKDLWTDDFGMGL